MILKSVSSVVCVVYLPVGRVVPLKAEAHELSLSVQLQALMNHALHLITLTGVKD